jgi:Holliday junction DNA helicase RuvA
MYESVRGTLLRRDLSNAVVEAGGVAYLLQVPLSTYEALPPAGAEVRLHVHLGVRPDEWRMYGFATPEERSVFRALLRVSGVGPAVALALLSGLRPAELEAAVAGGDVHALTRVKGVGRKTAERIVVELRDVFDRAGAAVALPGSVAAVPAVADAVRALASLGLDPAEASRRVARHAADRDPATLDAADLIRQALRG